VLSQDRLVMGLWGVVTRIPAYGDKQPHLLIDIMQDNQLALQFEKLSLKNRNIKKLILTFRQICAALPKGHGKT
jgi:hypothetical protein